MHFEFSSVIMLLCCQSALVSFSLLCLKAEELKNLIQSEYILWVSQYLVMKRASIEPNFHQLYVEFMESLELSTVTREVLKETYRNIKVGSYKYKCRGHGKALRMTLARSHN